MIGNGLSILYILLAIGSRIGITKKTVRKKEKEKQKMKNQKKHIKTGNRQTAYLNLLTKTSNLQIIASFNANYEKEAKHMRKKRKKTTQIG